jgi:hypothetical protein
MVSMDARILSLAEAATSRPTVISPGRDLTASRPASGAGSPPCSRFALEQMWERKLGEVIALAGACQSMSAAGDDLTGDGATLPSFGLYRRTAAAYEELAAIADAIERSDDGSGCP